MKVTRCVSLLCAIRRFALSVDGAALSGVLLSPAWLLTAPGNIGPHWTHTRPHRPWAGNDWLFCFDDELKGVKRANYPQLTKEMNPSRRSWWVGDGRINVPCLFSWSPSTRGSWLCLNSTCNSRREIISHFQPGVVWCGPVWVRCCPVRCYRCRNHLLMALHRRFKWLLKTFLFVSWDRGALWLTVKAAP